MKGKLSPAFFSSLLASPSLSFSSVPLLHTPQHASYSWSRCCCCCCSSPCVWKTRTETCGKKTDTRTYKKISRDTTMHTLSLSLPLSLSLLSLLLACSCIQNTHTNTQCRLSPSLLLPPWSHSFPLLLFPWRTQKHAHKNSVPPFPFFSLLGLTPFPFFSFLGELPTY